MVKKIFLIMSLLSVLPVFCAEKEIDLSGAVSIVEEVLEDSVFDKVHNRYAELLMAAGVGAIAYGMIKNPSFSAQLHTTGGSIIVAGAIHWLLRQNKTTPKITRVSDVDLYTHLIFAHTDEDNIELTKEFSETFMRFSVFKQRHIIDSLMDAYHVAQIHNKN